jgi:outer membrane protein TolC
MDEMKEGIYNSGRLHRNYLYTIPGKQQSKRNRLIGRYALTLAVMVTLFDLPFQRAAAQSAAPASGAESAVQLAQPPGAGQSAPPITVTFQDALERARKNDAQFLAAQGDAKNAHEDRLQARNAMLPSVSDSTQFLGTQGNGKTAEGRFVTNDGVHVYREWAIIHEDISPTNYMLNGLHRASVAEAIAKAKVEITRRGLTVAVTKTYYALAVAQRKYATAQQTLDQAKGFFDVTQDQERAGLAAHSDAVKAEIQFRQQEQAFEEAKLAMEDARLDLTVILFSTLNENFSIVDDLDSPQALPAFAEIQAMAGRENPDIRVATETLREASLDVSAAKSAFLPSLSIETDYGIEANDFALHAVAKAHPELGPLPTLGYFITANLTIPVWDWGTLRSKLHQSEYKQEEARTSLSLAQRQTLSELYASYNEASVAQGALAASRHTADLADESLRLVNLRYRAGESPATEVVDAENTLTTARNAYIDAGVRYRLALATLQGFTGSF